MHRRQCRRQHHHMHQQRRRLIHRPPASSSRWTVASAHRRWPVEPSQCGRTTRTYCRTRVRACRSCSCSTRRRVACTECSASSTWSQHRQL
jgi:hypothetical protein